MDYVKVMVRKDVARWLGYKFRMSHGVLDVKGSFVGDMVVAGLSRGLKCCTVRGAGYEKYVPVKLSVAARWIRLYGDAMCKDCEISFSRCLSDMLVDELSRTVMYGHVFGGMARDKLIQDLVFAHGYEDDEVSLARIRKIYQRKYRELESDLRLVHAGVIHT